MPRRSDVAPITFLEKRAKTKTCYAIADLLNWRSHQISWIVRNPLERPKGATRKVVVLKLRKARDLRAQDIPRAVVTDRGRTLFSNPDDRLQILSVTIPLELSPSTLARA